MTWKWFGTVTHSDYGEVFDGQVAALQPNIRWWPGDDASEAIVSVWTGAPGAQSVAAVEVAVAAAPKAPAPPATVKSVEYEYLGEDEPMAPSPGLVGEVVKQLVKEYILEEGLQLLLGLFDPPEPLDHMNLSPRAMLAVTVRGHTVRVPLDGLWSPRRIGPALVRLEIVGPSRVGYVHIRADKEDGRTR